MPGRRSRLDEQERRVGGHVVTPRATGREPGPVPVMRSAGQRGLPPPLHRRALALWPRLDARALRRCGHDPRRIALLVSRRTSLSVEAITVMLLTPVVSAQEAETWFG